jgi:chromosome segregation ATPase
MTEDVNPRAVMGANNPPEPTPFDVAKEEVDGLYGEAALWLDGAKVEDQKTADAIAKLLNMLRAAEKSADSARKVEKEPHDKAAKAVDAKFKPLLERVKLASDACKKALAPWLEKLEAEKRAAAEKARQEAEAKARAAQDALRAADAANLAARAEAEELVKQAKKAEAAASRAEKDTANASGGVGRAVSLRTVYRAEVADYTAAARHFWKAAPDEMRAFVQKLAEDTVRSAGSNAPTLAIPGVIVHTEKKAV